VHLDLRWRELREDIDRHGAQLPTAEDEHGRGQTDDQEAKFQTRGDNPAH
jgi:hypothetical protein